MPPPEEDNFDAKYTNSEWKDANSEQMQRSISQLKRPSIQKLFAGYYHDETIAKAQQREEPQSAFFQQMPTTTKKTETVHLEHSSTPTNSNLEQSRVSFTLLGLTFNSSIMAEETRPCRTRKVPHHKTLESNGMLRHRAQHSSRSRLPAAQTLTRTNTARSRCNRAPKMQATGRLRSVLPAMSPQVTFCISRRTCTEGSTCRCLARTFRILGTPSMRTRCHSSTHLS